nr:putative late gene regulator [Raoultella sp. NCTC 9187]
MFTNKVTYPDGKPPKWVKVTKGISPSDWEEVKSVREHVRVLCQKCHGKGNVSAACNDCHGRGKVVNQDETERQVYLSWVTAKRCGGRGYERILSTAVHSAICQITDAITLDTWKKSVKSFFDELITKIRYRGGLGRGTAQTNNALSYLLFPNSC